MCGYIRRTTDSPAIKALLIQLGLEELIDPLVHRFTGTEHFYPAFGGNPRRQIRGLIIEDAGHYKVVDATWWFDCAEEGDQLIVGNKTTFNARNLSSPFWKGALRHHRGIVLATGLGESKKVGGKKHQFLMESKQAFLLGALYRPFSNGLYSCAVITRDAHSKFEPYHDKAFPLFLPPDAQFVATWLADEVQQSTDIDCLLEHPVLYPTLTVAEVKTFKSGVKKGEEISLSSDIPD